MPGEEVWGCSVIPASPEKMVTAKAVQSRYCQAKVNTVKGTLKSPYCITLHSTWSCQIENIIENSSVVSYIT